MNLNFVRVGHGLDLQKSSYICANVAYGVWRKWPATFIDFRRVEEHYKVGDGHHFKPIYSYACC